MGTDGRPEGRWGAALIKYMKRGFSHMSPGQQDRLAPGLFDLCEAAHHVTVTEPLLRAMGRDAASFATGAYPAHKEYSVVTLAWLESLTVVCNLPTESGEACLGVLAKFYGSDWDPLPTQSAWECPKCNQFQ